MTGSEEGGTGLWCLEIWHEGNGLQLHQGKFELDNELTSATWFSFSAPNKM